MDRALVFVTIAYLVPTFIIGYVWHLKLFEGYYRDLEIYRPAVIIPFGFLAILAQGLLFGWAYLRLMDVPASFRDGLTFAGAAALLSWTFTTLAVGAKHRMSSVERFVRIETAFTATQFAVVGLCWPMAVRLS